MYLGGELPHREAQLPSGRLAPGGRANLQQVLSGRKSINWQVDTAVRSASAKLLLAEHQ